MNIFGIAAWYFGVRVNDGIPIKSVYLYDHRLRMEALFAISAPGLRFRHLLMILHYRVRKWCQRLYRLWWNNKLVIRLRWRWANAVFCLRAWIRGRGV